jgi:hypothetical protein
MLNKDYGRKGSVAEKISGRDLVGLGAKTNWFYGKPLVLK